MMNALAYPITVAVTSRGNRETSMRSIGFLWVELDSRSVIETPTIVDVADNKCGELQY